MKWTKKYKKEYQKKWLKTEGGKRYLEHHKEYCKEWYQKNKETRKKKNKEWMEKNKKDFKKYQRNWYKENSENVKKRAYMWHKQKKKTDPKYRLDCNIGTAIYRCLKNKKEGEKWEKLVGYTLKELFEHLEGKFEPWMNWNNYGRVDKGEKVWNIDHIKPISLFEYENPEDPGFKKCWALDNLQPIEAMANIKKSNVY